MVNYKRLQGGKIEYRGEVFPGFNKPKQAPVGSNKKKVVLAKYGDIIKKVSYGARGYSGFTKHKDEDRRKRYLARHKAIKKKDGTLAYKDRLSPAYRAIKDLR